MDKNINVKYVSDEYIKSYYFKTIVFQIWEKLIWFTVFYPVLAIFIYMETHNISSVYGGILIGLPILLMTYIGRKNKKIIKIVLVSIIITIVTSIISILVSGLYEFTMFLIPWMIISIKESSKTQRINFTISSIVLGELAILVALLFANMMELYKLCPFILIEGIVMGILSLIYLHKVRTLRLFIKDNMNGGNVNVSSGDTRASFLLIGVTIVISVIVILYTTGIFTYSSNYTRRFSNFLKSSVTNINDDFNYDTNEENDENMDDFDSLFNNNSVEESMLTKVMDIIARVIILVLKIAIAIAILAFIYSVINYCIIQLKRSKDNDKVEFILNKDNDINKKKIKKHLNRSFINDMLKSSNRDKVRRKYKRTILKSFKNDRKIMRSYTVDDIKKIIENQNNNHIESISKIYEKARYSNEEISDSEVKDM